MEKYTVQHPKVTIIGAGSLSLIRKAIWQMIDSKHLNSGTLALVDKNQETVEKISILAKKIAAHCGVKLTVETATNARDVLPGSDFIILSFANRPIYFKEIDSRIALKYGIRVNSGDTIGPGGVFRALREIPIVLQYCRDIEELCPEAWIINFVNPSMTIGMAIRNTMPNLKFMSICSLLHMLQIKKASAFRAGIIPHEDAWTPDLDEKFKIQVAGPNHFTWVLKAEYEAKDVMPLIAEKMRKQGEEELKHDSDKGAFDYRKAIGYELYKAFGSLPAYPGYAMEYVPFWQGKGIVPEAIPPIQLYTQEEKETKSAEMWKQIDDFNNGTIPIDDYMTSFGPDIATDIIESMWGGLNKPYYLMITNNGSVSNMPDDSFLELLCDANMKGITPRPVGKAPIGLRGMWQEILDTHELTALAAVTHDRDLVYRALVCDPLISSLADSKAIMDELFTLERDALPEEWYK